MKMVFGRPAGLTDTKQRYCPGCGHGIVHRLIAELMIELDIRERTVGIAPVGCSVFADEYFNCDMIQPPHGRGPAVSTGIKRARPECIVFSYQGDGDLAAIGTAETVHAAARNENITLIFINNAIYGMPGGQLAPTTLPGMRSTTSVKGRDIYKKGYPIKVVELINALGRHAGPGKKMDQRRDDEILSDRGIPEPRQGGEEMTREIILSGFGGQ